MIQVKSKEKYLSLKWKELILWDYFWDQKDVIKKDLNSNLDVKFLSEASNKKQC